MSIVWCVSGSRHLTATEPRAGKMFWALHNAWTDGRPDVFIHGAAKGVDTVAASYMSSSTPPPYILAMPAQWNRLGNPAGMARNRSMITVAYEMKECGWDVRFFAFPAKDSVGTRGFIKHAEEMGFFVEIHELD